MSKKEDQESDALLSKAESVASFLKWIREYVDAATPSQGVKAQEGWIERLFAESQRIRREAHPNPQAAGRRANGYHNLAVRLRYDLLHIGVAASELPSLEPPAPELLAPGDSAMDRGLFVENNPEPAIVSGDLAEDDVPNIELLGDKRVPMDRRLSADIPDLNDVPSYDSVDKLVNPEKQKKAEDFKQAFCLARDAFFKLDLLQSVQPPMIVDASDTEKILIIRTVKFRKSTLIYNWNCVVGGKVAGTGHPLMLEGPDGKSLVGRRYHEDDDRYTRALRVENGTLLRYFLHEGPADGTSKGKNLDPHARYYQVRNSAIVKLSAKEFWALEAAAKDTHAA